MSARSRRRSALALTALLLAGCADSRADEPTAAARTVSRAPIVAAALSPVMAAARTVQQAPVSAASPSPATAEPVPVAAPAAVGPRVDPRATRGEVPFGDIKLQLELGTLSVEQVSSLLARAQAELPDPNERLTFLLERFKRTPFAYESQLPIPPPGTLRVRLQTFGCTGLAIYMLALASAGSFEEFVHSLRKLRYWQSETRGVDSEPVGGNILDFTEDIFLGSALKQGFVADVTAEVAGDTPRTTFRSRLTPHRRNPEEDPGRHLIVPKLHPGKVLSLQLLSRAAFTQMDRSRIKTGDILLFSRVVPGPEPSDELMFGHAAIALNRGGEIYMVHATRDYVFRPQAKPGDPSIAAGVYYLQDPRREQLGVGVATDWVRDPRGRHIRIDGKSYYGYSPDQLRPVYDYLVGAHIQGLMVLRPQNRSAEARAADRRFLAAAVASAAGGKPAPSCPPADDQAAAAIVDSHMTVEQAVRANLARECPPAIAERQQLVEVSYFARDGRLHKGQLVLDSSVADDARAVFAVIRQTRFPVESVIPIAHQAFARDGRADDLLSMQANNTSGFNFRPQTGSRRLSAHACGLAIDLNPGQNPYAKGRGAARIVLPPGAVYDRSVPGTLTADHPVTRKFKELGWKWGGEFRSLKDFQHFEKGSCNQ